MQATASRFSRTLGYKLGLSNLHGKCFALRAVPPAPLGQNLTRLECYQFSRARRVLWSLGRRFIIKLVLRTSSYSYVKVKQWKDTDQQEGSGPDVLTGLVSNLWHTLHQQVRGPVETYIEKLKIHSLRNLRGCIQGKWFKSYPCGHGDSHLLSYPLTG